MLMYRTRRAKRSGGELEPMIISQSICRRKSLPLQIVNCWWIEEQFGRAEMSFNVFLGELLL